MNEKPITRIDLESINPHLTRVKQWREGWVEGGNTAPDIDQTVQVSIYMLLPQYEKQGFTCNMRDRDHGQALRGKTTRIDLIQMPDGWHYRKWPYGWEPKTRPMSEEIKSADEVAQILAWCEAHGWTVRRWPGGARAFLGQPKPVRDRAGILAVRRQAEQEFQRRENIGTNKIFYDFAFDY